jgi:type II secretory pathway component PulF
MALLYETGDARCETMIRTSAKTVANHAARDDLLNAAKAIEQQATVSEAFARVALLNENEQGIIEVGELSGSLERSFERIADDSESSMMARLALLQPFLNRLVMACVAFSIATTMMRLFTSG